jgi:WD40 repeat protein
MEHPLIDKVRDRADRATRGGTVPDPIVEADVMALLDGTDWAAVLTPPEPAHADTVPPALTRLREILFELERVSGVGAAHRAASARVLSATPRWRLTANQARWGLHSSFALSPDGRYLAMGSVTGLHYDNGGSIHVWETASGRCVNVLDSVEGGIDTGRSPYRPNRMRWHPSEPVLGAIFLVNMLGLFHPFQEFEPFQRPYFMGVAETWDSAPGWCWSPDGRRYAIGLEATAHITGQSSVVPFVLGDHPDAGGPFWASVCDPTRVAAGYDRPGEEIDPCLTDRPLAVDWSNDGRRILGTGTAGDAHRALVFEVDTETLSTIDIGAAATGTYENAAVFSPDGRLVALPAEDTLIVAEVRTAADRPSPDGSGPRRAELVDRLRLETPDGASVWGTVWSPDGDRVAALTTSAVIVAAGPSGPGAAPVVVRLPVRPAPLPSGERWAFGDVRRLAFDATGHRVAVLTSCPPTGDHRTIQVWDIDAPPTLLWSTPVDAGTVGVTFADSDRTVIGFGPDVLDFHDATTGQPRSRHLLPTEYDAPGEPLAIWGWNYGEPDGTESFLLPARGNRSSWCWASSFDTGLVLCPPEARPALAATLSFVLDRRFAWPAHWADGTDHLEIHDDWRTAQHSRRLPTEVRADNWADWRTWIFGAPERPAPDRATGFRRVDPTTIWPDWTPQGAPDLAVAELVEMPARKEPGCYIEDRIWPVAQLTEALLRSLLGAAVLIRNRDDVWARPVLGAVFAAGHDANGQLIATIVSRSESGISGYHLAGIHSLATVRYLGHNDDAVLPSDEPRPTS